ncbi:hypothetical protein [Pseudorhodoferax soli]|uniref:Uncharacterized protein n=1 Tax=Pseudorhodoferax soli TaxID=545864 RepID=A0A368X6N1_9BURK|nr:hypothetical protein [Pseudorhodoferax soli]RCW63652.1 hypothetical protein DES41_11848 [Pseudorhodoferax soli]
MNELPQPSTALDSFFGKLAEVNQFFARFDPLAMLQDGAWVRLDDRRKRFTRSSGVQVARGELNGHGSIGSFWFFPREALGDSDKRPSAAVPTRAIPVLDLRHLTTAEARKRILRDGVRLPDHQPRQAFVLLSEGRYGRFKFEKSGTTWVARLPADGVVELPTIDASWNPYQHSDDFAYLPIEAGTGSTGELIDWTPDREFLARILERYRAAVDSYFGLSSKGVEDPAKRLLKSLTDARVVGEEARISDVSIRRLREGWPAAVESLDAVQELGELLIKSEAGKSLLERVVASRAQTMLADIERQARATLEESLRQRREEVRGLDDEIQTLLSEKLRLETEGIRAREAADEADRKVKSAGDELAVRQRALSRSAEELAASDRNRAAAEARAMTAASEESVAEQRVRSFKLELEGLAAQLLDSTEAANLVGDERAAQLGLRLKGLLGSSATPMHSAPWWSPTGDAPLEIGLAELPSRLDHEARFFGVQTADVQLLDGALRAGELVLLVGVASELALGALARAVAGGRVRNQVLDPSAIGLDDLWRVPGSHRPTAFAMAWNRAVLEPESTVLLCLRNLDSAPFRLWIGSLRAVLNSSSRPSNLLVVSTMVGRDSDDDEFPDAFALRRDLIAIKARFEPDGYRCDYALGAEAGIPTTLTADLASRALKPKSPPTQLRRDEHAPVTVARALRLRAALEGSQASDVALSWATFLTTGRLDDLDEPLRGAHAELKALHLQR